jgi:hypothetical protein
VSKPPALEILRPRPATPDPAHSIYSVVYEEKSPAPGQRSFRVIADGVTMARVDVAEEWCDEEFRAYLNLLSARYGRRALLSLVR